MPESVLDVDVVGLHKPDYTNPHVSNHKAKFEEWLLTKYEKKGLRWFAEGLNMTKKKSRFI